MLIEKQPTIQFLSKPKCYLLIVGLLFVGKAQSQPIITINCNDQKTVLSNLATALERNYVYPDKGKILSEYLNKKIVKEGCDSLSDSSHWAAVITNDCRKITNDKHLKLEYNPKLESEINEFTQSNKGKRKVTDSNNQEEEKENFFFKKAEILPSNIGYLQFTGFPLPSTSALKSVQASMQFIAHTDALIIDLRDNHGGNPTSANNILSYFFETKTLVSKDFNKIENKWTNNYIESKKSITNGLTLRMPVYILTSHRTYSAAEFFSYTLQSAKKATVVGETTAGGAHLARSFNIGSGFVAFIPFLRSENTITKTDWETVGVTPDIVAKEESSIVIAQLEFLKNQIAVTTDTTQKRKLNWYYNFHQSQLVHLTIQDSLLLQYIGNYAEFEITANNNQLQFRDTNQPTKNYLKMWPISTNLFQVGNDYQIEFLTEPKTRSYKAVLYWSDGWVDTVAKSPNMDMILKNNK